MLPYVVFGDYPDQNCTEIEDRVVVWGRAALLYFKSLGLGPP